MVRDVGPVLRLDASVAGELLTLQRAAYVSEAQIYDDARLPPLTQTLEEVVEELEDSRVPALGIRAGTRLVAAVRLLVRGEVADLGRLIVAPDLQGRGVGTQLLTSVDAWLPGEVNRIELFTGDRSVANLRLYERAGFRECDRRSAGSYDLVFLARATG